MSKITTINKTTEHTLPEVMLTREELAARWKVCKETLKRREKDGKLPFVKMGSRLKRYRLSDVLRLEAQMHVGGMQP